jgi:cytochrome c peroxidase
MSAGLLLLPLLSGLIGGAVACSKSKSNEVKGPKLEPFETVLGKLPVPPGNPQTPAKIELGKLLFFDARLSGNQKISCATCHDPAQGFTLPVARFVGPKGELGRNTPTIWNSAYVDFPFWDGRTSSLEEQAGGPMRADAEMGAKVPELLAHLKAVPEYQQRFKDVYGENGITFTNVAGAIAAFERTIISADSAWDRFQAGDKGALTDEQKTGRDLFFSERTSCNSCHTAPLFTDNKFHAIGVPQEGPKTEDLGRFNVSQDEQDKFAFKTPTLRNVERTAPYMHTGGLKTLEEVIGFYNGGAGNAPVKDPRIRRLNLTRDEERALVAFLKALTDESHNVTPPKLPGLAQPFGPGRANTAVGPKPTVAARHPWLHDLTFTPAL